MHKFTITSHFENSFFNNVSVNVTNRYEDVNLIFFLVKKYFKDLLTFNT
jgi:hypothetical protein